MTEEEIVKRLCRHFDENIQNARRMQNITSIRDMERYLNAEDVEERNNMFIRQGNMTRNIRTTGQQEIIGIQNNRTLFGYNFLR